MKMIMKNAQPMSFTKPKQSEGKYLLRSILITAQQSILDKNTGRFSRYDRRGSAYEQNCKSRISKRFGLAYSI